MSKTDTEHSDDAKAVVSVVLAIQCSNAQAYLCSTNAVLKALYGNSPYRLEVDVDEAGSDGSVTWELIYPFSDATKVRLGLFERFQNVTYEGMSGFLTSEEFITAVSWAITDSAVPGKGEGEIQQAWNHLVRVIMVNKDLLQEGSTLPRVFEKYFPNAIVFTVDYEVAVAPIPELWLPSN